MSDIVGLCHMCGKVAVGACKMCGRTACANHLDKKSGICMSCGRGRA